jgi:Holliday junction resolvasome RuvABC endonuclease subunit
MMGEARSGIIIGLDTSLLRTAYAIINDDALLAFGTIHTKEGLADRRDAWKLIRDEARRIERITHSHTQAVVIEDCWLGPNRQGSLNHARCVGHAEAFALHAFPYALIERVMPQSWRALLSLPRKGKEGAMSYSKRICDISTRQSGWADELDQDSADAICIAYAARAAYIADSSQE